MLSEASFRRGEAPRRLADVEKQRKRGPSLGEAWPWRTARNLSQEGVKEEEECVWRRGMSTAAWIDR